MELRARLARGLQRRIDPHVRPKMLERSGRVRISTSVAFNGPRANIHIADNVFIGHFSILDGTDRLTIGEGVQIAGWAGLYTHSSHISIRLLGDRYFGWEGERPGWVQEPLTIGPYAFLGVKCTVLPGCHVGRSALVAAHSLVNRPVPDFAIVSGTPARQVGDVRELDRPYLEPGSPWWETYTAGEE
jgi:acetyltransferase-like isoleucine patch superfamily enzyme